MPHAPCPQTDARNARHTQLGPRPSSLGPIRVALNYPGDPAPRPGALSWIDPGRTLLLQPVLRELRAGRADVLAARTGSQPHVLLALGRGGAVHRPGLQALA